MNRCLLALLLCSLAAPISAQAPVAPAAPLWDASYISGQPGVKRSIAEGRLVVTPDTLAFSAGSVRGFRMKYFPRFAIPLSHITKVTNTIDTGIDGGAVAAFGLLGMAAKRQDEYVFVTTETETTTDVVIFQVKKNTSAAAATKIAFAAKMAKAGAGLNP